MKGAEGFEAHYRQIFGARWERLRGALNAPTTTIDRVSRFMPSLTYRMDEASELAARALGVEPGHAVLDLCAAPGGKTLILAEGWMGLSETTPAPHQPLPSGRFIANERSSLRRERLKRVLSEYLPEPALSQIQVTGHDASRWGMHEKNSYDRVLADVPCSSERHLLHSPKDLAQWSPARARQLTVRQHAILASAVDATKPGGRVLYCTCALSPIENDGVVRRLREKRVVEALNAFPHGHPSAERTEFGTLFLPDLGGLGPLYVALLQKPQ